MPISSGALTTPPAGTRAAVRGDVLRRFGEDISAVEWDRVVFRRNGYDVTLRFDDVAGPEVDRLGRLVAGGADTGWIADRAGRGGKVRDMRDLVVAGRRWHAETEAPTKPAEAPTEPAAPEKEEDLRERRRRIIREIPDPTPQPGGQ